MTTDLLTLGSTSLLQLWQPWLRLAPASLVQPILPGWTLNVNSNNSSAPQTEADVVAKHSYGRQLGRMADALRLVILELQQNGQPLPRPFAEFLSMWEDIESVKTQGAEARLEQVVADLARLRACDSAAYQRLKGALREALQER
jgi:hypothetical protein